MELIEVFKLIKLNYKWDDNYIIMLVYLVGAGSPIFKICQIIWCYYYI